MKIRMQPLCVSILNISTNIIGLGLLFGDDN